MQPTNLLRAAVLTALCCCLLQNLKAQVPTIDNINYGSWTKIAQASGDNWMHFPHGISFDVPSGSAIVKKAIVGYNVTADVVQVVSQHGWMGSVNGGVTWNSPAPSTTSVDMNTIFRRRDGVMISVPFYPNGFTGANPQSSFTFNYDTSVDNGATWHTATYGLVNGFGSQLLGSFRFPRGVIEDADGTLYTPAYGQFRNADGTYQSHRAMLMKSTNGGATWTYVSTIQYTAGISYNETTIVRCRDGSILAVMRNDSNPLKYRRSTDNGVTWGGAVTPLPNVPANAGVDPYLYLMPNGVLVLAYGDNVPGNMRHCYLAFSPDGNGNSWTRVIATYTSSTSGLGNKSSGYTTVFPTRTNRFLQTSDRALYTYYGSDQHPDPNPFSIWTKQADMVLNYRNRIDLKKKYESGDITVTTDMTYSNATHPEARIAGAFDGSTDYWSSAFKSGNSGTMTIDLQTEHVLNAIGVCLATGAPQSATIEYSLDNSSWTNIKTYAAGTKHYTIDYTSIASPIRARYIRVNVNGSGLTGLNEIRLFSVADTYEDYALNIAPQGYSAPAGGFWVSEGVGTPTGYKSERALYLSDGDGTNKEISKTSFTAAAQKTLEFWLRVKAVPSAIQWRLVSGSTNAFRMRVAPGGAVQYYNGTSYVTLSGASIATDVWTHIKVAANASTGGGTLTINGTNSYTIGRETAVSTLNGFLFASGGAAATGDAALFDDVYFYTTGSTAREQTQQPETVALPADLTVQVFPNPVANKQATIAYTLPSAMQVQIEVIAMNGQRTSLISKKQEAGTYTLPWDMKGKASGVYVVRMMAGKKEKMVKVVVKGE